MERPPADVPSPALCRRILAEQGVPDAIIRHSDRVAALVLRLSGDLARAGSVKTDSRLLEAAALLHDIAKASTAGTSKDHAVEGGRLLGSMGFVRLAELVSHHMHPPPLPPREDITESHLLAYCDKRVLNEEVVSLEVRFRDLLARYGGVSPEAVPRIMKSAEAMEDLERRIFRDLPYPPEDLSP